MSRPRTIAARGGAPALADWVELVKPRIGAFVFLSSFVGGLLGAGASPDVARVFEAAFWITCAAAASSVFNQVFERDVDARMRRTQDRPLPSRRIKPAAAVGFGSALAVAAATGLALRFNLLAALLAVGTILAYVAVYTPLKQATTLNTLVGAIPGAAPPLLGYVALAGAPGAWAWALYAVVFTWQFPHFMAIAWLYREDYARAGMKMLPALPGTRGMAGRQALAHALVLIPVSLLPGVWGHAGIVYSLGALALGLAYAGAALRFALTEDAGRARVLLLVSLVYLPFLHALVLLDPMVRAAIEQTT